MTVFEGVDEWMDTIREKADALLYLSRMINEGS